MPTAIEIIRANLIGLPDEITDTVIQVIIDSSQSLHDAAIALAESAASLSAADNESIKLGTLAISSDVSASWLAIKDNLIKRKLTNTGVIVDPNEGALLVLASVLRFTVHKFLARSAKVSLITHHVTINHGDLIS